MFVVGRDARTAMPKVKYYVDKELLIKSVHERPVLWNKNMDIYKDKQLKSAAWREICAIMKEDFDQMDSLDSQAYVKSIIKIWAQTRDSWVRSIHTNSVQSRPYLYHKQMLFLKDVISNSDNQQEIHPIRKIRVKEEKDDAAEDEFESDDDGNFILQTYSSSNEEESRDAGRKRRKKCIEEVNVLNTNGEDELDTSRRIPDDERRTDYLVRRLSSIRRNEEDRHMLFFKSLLPSLASLNDDQTLEFQSSVISLLQNIRKRR